MKIGIVYYSRTGNTKKAAETLQNKIKEKKIDAKLVEIRHVKKPGFFKAGSAGMTQKEQPIQNTDFNLKKYDMIIVGSPTWGGRSSPYIQSFFNKAENFKGKKVGIFYTSAGETYKAKTGENLKEYLSEIGLNPIDDIIGFKMKKEEIQDGKQNIEKFVKTITTK